MPLRPARAGRVGVIGAPRGENRGRGQGRHTRPLARCEDRGGGRGRHLWAPSSPRPNLAPF